MGLKEEANSRELLQCHTAFASSDSYSFNICAAFAWEITQTGFEEESNLKWSHKFNTEFDKELIQTGFQ